MPQFCFHSSVQSRAPLCLIDLSQTVKRALVLNRVGALSESQPRLRHLQRVGSYSRNPLGKCTKSKGLETREGPQLGVLGFASNEDLLDSFIHCKLNSRVAAQQQTRRHACPQLCIPLFVDDSHNHVRNPFVLPTLQFQARVGHPEWLHKTHVDGTRDGAKQQV